MHSFIVCVKQVDSMKEEKLKTQDQAYLLKNTKLKYKVKN